MPHEVVRYEIHSGINITLKTIGLIIFITLHDVSHASLQLTSLPYFFDSPWMSVHIKHMQ